MPSAQTEMPGAVGCLRQLHSRSGPSLPPQPPVHPAMVLPPSVLRDDLSTPPKDPRVRRTRQALKQALIALVEDRDYDGISLTDVAKAAGVARQTIYDHYDNKDALFEEVLLDLVRMVYSDENLPKLVEHLRTGQELDGISLFFMADQHRQVLKTAVDRFYGGFSTVLEAVLIEVMATQSAPDSRLAQDAGHRRALAAFVSGGVVALLRLHLGGHFSSSREAEEFAALVSRGVVAALSIDLDEYAARQTAKAGT